MGSSLMGAFQYEQIRTLVNRLAPQYNVFCFLTRFELLLTVFQSLKKTLSTLYQILVSAVPSQDRVKSCWEKDLGLVFTSEQWNGIRGFNLHLSVNIAIQRTDTK